MILHCSWSITLVGQSIVVVRGSLKEGHQVKYGVEVWWTQDWNNKVKQKANFKQESSQTEGFPFIHYFLRDVSDLFTQEIRIEPQ